VLSKLKEANLATATVFGTYNYISSRH